MRLRLFTQAIVATALLAPLGVVTIAAPSGAAGPMITVTPNSGLTDGQVVTVAATGFTFPVPSLVGIEECTAGPVAPDGSTCDSTNTFELITPTADDFTASYTSYRHVDTKASGITDCAVPNSCEVIAGPIDHSQLATAPISFTAPFVNLSILNARSIRRVNPGDPVEVRVRAANEGPGTTNWDVTQTLGPGLSVNGETCGGVTVVGAADCAYSSSRPKVGHPVKTVFWLLATAGFAGTATDRVCVRDENANDADPQPSNNCLTLSIVVR